MITQVAIIEDADKLRESGTEVTLVMAGQLLREAIAKTGLSQAAVARAVDMNQTTLSNYVTGSQLPGVAQLDRIEEVEGLDITNARIAFEAVRMERDDSRRGVGRAEKRGGLGGKLMDASLRTTNEQTDAKQVTVSEEYTIEIPQEVREAISVEPGQQVVLIPMRGRIVLVPLMPLEELRERLHGIDTSPHPDWDIP